MIGGNCSPGLRFMMFWDMLGLKDELIIGAGRGDGGIKSPRS